MSKRIAVVGGGPGGLFFATLMKKRRPEWEITLFERNQADDAFGFGVVFSDQTLDTFRAADAESYAAIRDNFAYWDDIAVVHNGTRTVSVNLVSNSFATPVRAPSPMATKRVPACSS